MKLLVRLLVLLALGGVVAYLVGPALRPDALQVRLAAVELGVVEATVANTRAGTVKACRRAKLSPAIGGQVARMDVHEGDRVATGDVLFALWNEDRAARVTLALSETKAAAARIDEACLNAQVAEREARRQQQLADQNLVSEEQVDRATTQAGAARAVCAAVRAAHEVAEASVTAARADLALTYLTAPFAGVVAEVNAEIGEFVTPSPPGIQTLPAVDLIDDRCLYVSAPIDEVDAPRIRPGMPACVSLDAFPEPRCGARVRRIAPYVLDREKQARTVEIEVDFASERDAEGLLPGYTADVEIVLERRDAVPRVATEAVLEGPRVLVYDPDSGTAVSRAFEAGLANWRFTEVRGGLAAGERVVLSVDLEGVAAGARVEPLP